MPGSLARTRRVPGKTPPDASGAGLTPDPQEPSDVPALRDPRPQGEMRFADRHGLPSRRGKALRRPPSARPFAKPAFPRTVPFCRRALSASRVLASSAPPASAKRPLAAAPPGARTHPRGSVPSAARLRPWGAQALRLGSAGLGAEAARSVRRVTLPTHRLAAPGGRSLNGLATARAGCGLVDPRSGGLRPMHADRLAPAAWPALAGPRKSLRGASPTSRRNSY